MSLSKKEILKNLKESRSAMFFFKDFPDNVTRFIYERLMTFERDDCLKMLAAFTGSLNENGLERVELPDFSNNDTPFKTNLTDKEFESVTTDLESLFSELVIGVKIGDFVEKIFFICKSLLTFDKQLHAFKIVLDNLLICFPLNETEDDNSIDKFVRDLEVKEGILLDTFADYLKNLEPPYDIEVILDKVIAFSVNDFSKELKHIVLAIYTKFLIGIAKEEGKMQTLFGVKKLFEIKEKEEELLKSLKDLSDGMVN